MVVNYSSRPEMDTEFWNISERTDRHRVGGWGTNIFKYIQYRGEPERVWLTESVNDRKK